VKLRSVLGIVALAVLAQAVLVRFAVGGRLVFDFVLVGVVYVALRGDARAGLIGGTVGGLMQDVLSGGVIGVGGLAKTLVGGGAGGIGSRFVVTKPHSRALIVAGASVAHRLLMILMTSIIAEQWPTFSPADMLEETVVNSVSAWVLFYATDALPAAVERRRLHQQARWGRRSW